MNTITKKEIAKEWHDCHCKDEKCSGQLYLSYDEVIYLMSQLREEVKDKADKKIEGYKRIGMFLDEHFPELKEMREVYQPRFS